MGNKEQGLIGHNDYFFHYYLSTHTIFFMKNLSAVIMLCKYLYKVKAQCLKNGSKITEPPK